MPTNPNTPKGNPQAGKGSTTNKPGMGSDKSGSRESQGQNVPSPSSPRPKGSSSK